MGFRIIDLRKYEINKTLRSSFSGLCSTQDPRSQYVMQNLKSRHNKWFEKEMIDETSAQPTYIKKNDEFEPH